MYQCKKYEINQTPDYPTCDMTCLGWSKENVILILVYWGNLYDLLHLNIGTWGLFWKVKIALWQSILLLHDFHSFLMVASL